MASTPPSRMRSRTWSRTQAKRSCGRKRRASWWPSPFSSIILTCKPCRVTPNRAEAPMLLGSNRRHGELKHDAGFFASAYADLLGGNDWLAIPLNLAGQSVIVFLAGIERRRNEHA